MNRMGKYLTFILTLVVFLSNPVNAENEKVRVILDGSGVDIETILENNRTYVPLKALAEELNLKVEYIADDIKITKNNSNISLNLYSKKAIVDDKNLGMDVNLLKKDEEVFVPLRFIAENIGKNVIWDGDNYNVLVGELNQDEIIEDSFIYLNNEYGYSLRFPNSWKDEALIKTKDGRLYVYDKKTAERFIEDGVTNFGPVFEVRLNDYSITSGLTYSDDYVLYYKDGKYIEALFGSDFQFYPETADSYKKIYNEGLKVLGSFKKIDDSLEEVDSHNSEILTFWDELVEIPENFTGLDIYWRYIDDDITENVDNLVGKYGVDILFKGLESNNPYSQYYCINRLVEYYNDDYIRLKSVERIRPFLESENIKLKDSADFAISVLTKEFNSPHIVDIDKETKVFPLFNNYSDYGSYNELWIIKNDKLSKLHKFKDPQAYIDSSEKIQISPLRDKIAVKTSSRKSSSINIIDLNTGEISPELIKLSIEKVALDNKNYRNTHPDGAYSWASNLEWLDNDRLKFDAALSYNFTDIIEKVTLKYNLLDDSLEYI